MICVSIQEKDFHRCKEILGQTEMVELRGDLCLFTTQQTKDLVSMHPNLIYTHRINNTSMSLAEEQICTAIDAGAKYIDIEIDVPEDFLSSIRSYANTKGCKLIISYHNFSETPTWEMLCEIYDACCQKGAHIVKISTTAQNISDTTSVLRLYHQPLPIPLVAFCMGEIGKFSRDLCLYWGAPFTYVSLNKNLQTAPGQYTHEEMVQLLDIDRYPYSIPPLSKTIFSHKTTVQIPCSKSIAQRAILAAALAQGTTILENFETCKDVLDALLIVQSLGAKIDIQGQTLSITSDGAKALKLPSNICVGESGLLARLLIPLATYLSKSTTSSIEINGTGSLLKRNLNETIQSLQTTGVTCQTNGNFLPFRIKGKINSTEIRFSGRESSQIVSGFLMTLPLLAQDTTLIITQPSSIPYLELTCNTLRSFGISLQCEYQLPEQIMYRIQGNQQYRPTQLHLEADWSSAAYFAVAGALNQGITLQNMSLNSAQADAFILELLQCFHIPIRKIDRGPFYDIEIGPQTDGCKNQHPLHFSLHDCPDLFPIAVVLAGNMSCPVLLEGVNRLTHKESNRAETIYHELSKLGYMLHIEGNFMYIYGRFDHSKVWHKPTIGVNGHNDHRIAMMLCVAALCCDYKIKLDDIGCMAKSFPSFWSKIKQ